MTPDEYRNQMRLAFEAWCINNCHCSLRKVFGYDTYESNRTRLMWKAFKAGWEAKNNESN